MKKIYDLLGKAAIIAGIVAIILKTADFIRKEMLLLNPNLDKDERNTHADN